MESKTPLNDLGAEIHRRSLLKGFYDRAVLESVSGETVVNPSIASEKLLLVVSEVAEIQDAMRDEDFDAECEEVADVVIRILDYAAWRGIDLDAWVAEKMAKNEKRPRLHGRKAF